MNTKTTVPSVDWMTCTATSEPARQELEQMFYKRQKQLIFDKHQFNVWKWRGYRGWTSTHLAYGRRKADDIIILRGAYANLVFSDFINRAENVSRIDLAVTCEMDPPRSTLISDYYREVTEKNQKTHRLKNFSYITNNKGGKTMYFGLRGSPAYGRIYDKGIQAGTHDAGHVIRWEVELKKPYAYKTAKNLVNNGDIGMNIVSSVHKWFSDRMIDELFEIRDGYNIIERDIKSPDRDRTIRWLRTSVEPLLETLIGEGYTRDLIDIFQPHIDKANLIERFIVNGEN